MKMNKKKNKLGRKWFDGKNETKVISDCKYIWGIGGNDKEAALYSEISDKSLSRYLQAHLDIKLLRDKLRDYPIIKARQTVTDKLSESYQNAMDYLKRKRKEEFGDRSTVDIELPVP